MDIDIAIPSQFADLVQYVSCYSGLYGIRRLQCIARFIPSLAVDALTLALENVKKYTTDIVLYDEILKELCNVSTNPPQPDAEWLNATELSCATTLEELKAALNASKNKQIQASIYNSYFELGLFYSKQGNHNLAAKMFSSTVAINEKQQFDLNMLLVKVYLDLGSMFKASYKCAQMEAHAPPETISFLKSIQGSNAMGLEKYGEAARFFSKCNMEHFENDVFKYLSPADIGTYGGLCAIASYTRKELKELVNQPNFKEFLELVPLVRDVIDNYIRARYRACLSMIRQLENEIVYDLELFKIAKQLMDHIKTKAMIQYVAPYSALNITTMADAFLIPVKELEYQLGQLILEEKINMKIDSHNKILLQTPVDQTKLLFNEALSFGAQYQHNTIQYLLRTSMARENVRVKSSRSSFKDHHYPDRDMEPDWTRGSASNSNY